MQLPLILLTGKYLGTLVGTKLVRLVTMVWFVSARSIGTSSSLEELVLLLSSLDR